MRTANHSYLATHVVAPLLMLACSSCLDTASKHNDDTKSVAGGGGAGTSPSAGAGEAGTGEAGASGSETDGSLVSGTGKMCSSYAAPVGDKCGGYFCGVDLATLEMAVSPTAKCGGSPDLLCKNSVITAVGTCARQVKSQMPAATNEVLRPMLEACVYQDPEIKAKVTPDCLACTIAAAECAAEMCLVECLAGDSELCDSCRKMNNCDQPVFACGGIPSPI